MKENQVKIIMILTVTSLILICIGLSYAYFSAFNDEGSTAEITVGPGKMLITYNDRTDNILPVTDIQPSDAILVNKTFSLTGTNTATGMVTGDGLVMPYKVGVKYTSTFSDGQIHYYIKEVNRPNGSNVTVEYTGTTNQTVQGNTTYTGYSHGTLNKENNKYTEMVTGEFPSSTSNQTITFNLILQFPDTGENQDSEKGATINGKIVVNYEPPKATTFAADSWENIAAVVQDGQLEAYPVGSEKEVEIGGTSYTLRVANNTTPTECNNEEFLHKLPSDLQKVIIDTKVITGHGSEDSENFTSIDKIYLLSGHEVWKDVTLTKASISANDTAYNNTRQLDYYANLGLTSKNYSGAIKTYTSSNFDWWLRTSVYDYSDGFLYVEDDGDWNGSYANTTKGFAPAFRIG